MGLVHSLASLQGSSFLSLGDEMESHDVDTFIDLLMEVIRSMVRLEMTKSEGEAAAGEIILNSHVESLREYLYYQLGIKTSQQEPEEYKCPECGSEMRERKNKQTGDRFYGCKKYPECRGTRDKDGLSKDDRREQNNKETPQQDGYSFRKKREPWNESGPTG